MEGVCADTQTSDLGWWCISGEAILDALRRCAGGESPDMVFAGLYVDSDHEYHDSNPDWRGER